MKSSKAMILAVMDVILAIAEKPATEVSLVLSICVDSFLFIR